MCYLIAFLGLRSEVHYTTHYHDKSPSKDIINNANSTFQIFHSQQYYDCYTSNNFETGTVNTTEEIETRLKEAMTGKCYKFKKLLHYYYNFCPYDRLERGIQGSDTLEILNEYNKSNTTGFQINENTLSSSWVSSTTNLTIEYECDYDLDKEAKVYYAETFSSGNSLVKLISPIVCQHKDLMPPNLIAINCYSSHKYVDKPSYTDEPIDIEEPHKTGNTIIDEENIDVTKILSENKNTNDDDDSFDAKEDL